MASSSTRDTSAKTRVVQRAKPARPDSSSLLIPVLGLAVLSFVAGATLAEFNFSPYPQVLRPSFIAAKAIHRRIATTSALTNTDIWCESRFDQRGMVKHDSQRAFPGYTLYTSGHSSSAFLIDMQGNIAHQWHLPYYDVWPESPHSKQPVPERFIHWRRTHLFPNGDLIALYEAAGDTPWGYGLVKVDRNSKLIWKFGENVHHDFVVAADGTIFALTHAFRDTQTNKLEDFAHLRRVLLDDFVVHLSPDGQLLQKVSILDALVDSPFAELLRPAAKHEWDILHANTVTMITPEFAAHHESLQPGQVMVSLRSRHALAVIDMETEKVVWASSGPYRFQHDPDLLDNGRIMIFDNRGHVGLGGPSRIVEFDPVSQAVHWTYTGDENDYFYSDVRSVQQLLPNGNVLITESSAGRIFEITREGQIVWDFRNPVDLDGDKKFIPIMCGAIRLEASEIQFELNGPPVATP